MTEFLTVIFFIEALIFLGIGLRVLITGRPFFLKARWFLGVMVLALSPMLIVSLSLSSNFANPVLLLNILLFFVLLIYFAILMKGYIAMGVTDESFRTAIHAALQQLNITFEETLAHIKLTSHDLDLQAAVQSWVGTAQLKIKQSNGKPILDEIAKAIEAYYQTHETKTNNVTAIFYIVVGLFMAVCAIVLITL